MKILADTFCKQLQQKLKTGLVGESAHLKMIPQGRELYPKGNANPRKSAVLVAFYYHNNELYFPLIKRAANNGLHSRQMALPGGKYEKEDIDLIQTALREAKEEVGINPKDVEVLGTMSEIYIGVTNFTVLPVVGFINYKPDFIPQISEVEEIRHIKISDLLNNENRTSEERIIRNEKIFVPYYNLANEKVWGATAMILSELESLLTE